MDSGLSVGEALAAFNAAQGGAGAIVSMLGKVRPDGDVKALELTHYEPLTLPGIQALADTARNRFSLTGAVVWHRIGVMEGDATYVERTVACSSKLPPSIGARMSNGHVGVPRCSHRHR